jgi:hypothetical protein
VAVVVPNKPIAPWLGAVTIAIKDKGDEMAMGS